MYWEKKYVGDGSKEDMNYEYNYEIKNASLIHPEIMTKSITSSSTFINIEYGS